MHIYIRGDGTRKFLFYALILNAQTVFFWNTDNWHFVFSFVVKDPRLAFKDYYQGGAERTIVIAQILRLCLVLCERGSNECFGLRKFCQLLTAESAKFRKNTNLKKWGKRVGEAAYIHTHMQAGSMYTFY